LEVVTGTGDVLRVGCRTVKCREGYDLLHLFIGSEGTLGIVTEATLRLAPLPEAFVGLMAEFDDVGSLVSAVVEARRRRLWPMVTEFLDDETSEALGLRRKYYLWIGADVNEGSEDRIMSKLSGAMTDVGGRITASARNMADFMSIMAPRRALYSGGLNVGFNIYGADALVIWEDIAVPISSLPNAVKELVELGREFGVKLLMGGHVGDGNLHPGLLIRKSAPEDEVKRYMGLISKIGELAIKYNGTVSAEHGIGVQKKVLIDMKYRSTGSDKALDIMRQVKQIFDPHDVLNPGKVLP
ncbi:MAG: FAD-binding oxidoreductase, partial [Conexivisphaera sp.]